MTAPVLIAALAISFPVAAVGWLVGALFDRWSNDPGQRHLLWTFALHLPAVMATGFIAVVLWKVSLFSSPAADAARSLTTAISGYGDTRVAGLSGAQAALALWGAGVAVCLLRVASGFRRARLLADRASEADAGFLGAGIPVRFSSALSAAVLVGLRRPMILLPVHFARPENRRAADLVCRHEAAHAARLDNLRICGEALLLAVFWFNPILYAVRRRLSASREELCDATVVAGLGAPERRLYADTLVEAFAARSSHLPVTSLLGLTRSNAAMRLSAILSPTPARSRPVVLAGFLLAMCSAGGAVAAIAGETAMASQAPPGAIDISGDTLTVARGANVQVWVGRPSIRGLANRDDVTVRLDGKPVDKAFDFDSIPQESLAAIVITQQSGGKSMDVDLISLKPPARAASSQTPGP